MHKLIKYPAYISQTKLPPIQEYFFNKIQNIMKERHNKDRLLLTTYHFIYRGRKWIRVKIYICFLHFPVFGKAFYLLFNPFYATGIFPYPSKHQKSRGMKWTNGMKWINSFMRRFISYRNQSIDLQGKLIN